MKKNRKMRNIFALGLVSMTIASIAIMAAYMFYMNSSHYRQEFDIGINNNLVTVSNVVTNFDINNRKITSMLCDYPDVKTIEKVTDENVIMNTIDLFEKNFTETKRIGIGLENGKMIKRKEILLSEGFDPRKRIWYTEAILNPREVILTKPYKSAVQNEDEVITYSKTITDSNNKIVGVIGSDVNLDTIKKTISNVKIGESGFIVILDSSRQVILNSDEKKYKGFSNNKKWIDEILDDKVNHSKIIIDGKQYINYHVENSATNWNIVAIMPQKEFDTQIFNIGFTIAVISILLSLVSILIGNFLANKLIKPSEDIIEALNKAGAGDYSVRADGSKKMPKEMHIIVQSLNNTISKVETQSNDLAAQNEEIVAQNEEISSLYQQTSAMNSELNDLLDEIKTEYRQTVMALANAIEASDEYTKGHCERVTVYSVQIAKNMNLSYDEVAKVEIAALLHDIGKIGVPLHILNKNGKLTEEEYEIVKRHPAIGYNIIKDIAFLKDSRQILFEHHERIDGKGYPQGLSGEKISKYAKILSVADSYDAMTSSRPYREVPLTKEKAIEQLVLNKGTQFDPEIVEIFIKVINEEKI